MIFRLGKSDSKRKKVWSIDHSLYQGNTIKEVIQTGFLRSTVATSATGDLRQPSVRPPYSLSSLPQSQLLLYSPLKSPSRQRHINLVSDSSGASADMPGSAVDPAAMTDEEKLNFLIAQMTSVTEQQTTLLAQVTTINGRLDTHDQRLATQEKAPAAPDADAEEINPSRGGVAGYTSAGDSNTLGVAGGGDLDADGAGRGSGGHDLDVTGGHGGVGGGGFGGGPGDGISLVLFVFVVLYMVVRKTAS
jgi:hypothetical protein